jgi:cobalt/nickel transport system permease protein
MHIPDGFLSPVLTIPAYVASAPFWAWGVRRHFGPSQTEALPVIGSLTALAVVIQTLMIPIPGGTSVHLLGVPLLALLYNPLVAFVCESLVLLLQALFLGAGGITVLGVNALALGLLGPLAARLTFHVFARWSARGAAFVAAWVATQVSALAVTAALGLQHHLDATYFPTPYPVVLAATLIPSMTVAGIAEGAYTLVALTLLRKANLRGLH